MTDETFFTLQDAAGKKWDFKHVSQLRSLLTTELEFWSHELDALGLQIHQIHGYFNVRNRISASLSYIDELIENRDSWEELHEDAINQKVSQIQQSLNGLHSHWLWSNHAYTRLFINVHKKYGKDAASQFFNVVQGQYFQSKNVAIRSDIFNSALLAYEFLHQDSDITKRRKSEKASLSRLRTRLDQTTTELIGEVEDFKTGIQQWNDGNGRGGKIRLLKSMLLHRVSAVRSFPIIFLNAKLTLLILSPFIEKS